MGLREKKPEYMNRRKFIKLAGIAVTGSAVSLNTACQSTPKKLSPIDHNLSDMKFWKNVQDQFILDPKQTYMNIGTTGAMPQRILDNYDRYNRIIASHPMGFSDELGWDFGFSKQREKLGKQFGCSKDEIIVSRNTTDGLNTILFGLPFERGDEILITHHEHVSALAPLNILKDRLGLVLKEVEIPVLNLENSEQIIEAFRKQITTHTKAILFSHIPYKTGARLPAKGLCMLAQEHELISIVDGAHCAGMIELNFNDMGCDFYAASGHKWQCGPGATGILYIRNHGDNLPILWPQNSCLYQYVSQPVKNDRLQIEDFSSMFGLRGQENYPALQAMLDACDLWEEIGRDIIETYICELSSYLKKKLEYTFGESALLFSPDIPEFTSGLTSFNPFKDINDGERIKDFVDRLKREMGYVIRYTEFHQRKDDSKPTFALRISTHLFHDKNQVDNVVNAMYRLWKTML